MNSVSHGVVNKRSRSRVSASRRPRRCSRSTRAPSGVPISLVDCGRGSMIDRRACTDRPPARRPTGTTTSGIEPPRRCCASGPPPRSSHPRAHVAATSAGCPMPHQRARLRTLREHALNSVQHASRCRARLCAGMRAALPMRSRTSLTSAHQAFGVRRWARTLARRYESPSRRRAPTQESRRSASTPLSNRTRPPVRLCGASRPPYDGTPRGPRRTTGDVILVASEAASRADPCYATRIQCAAADRRR